MKSLIIICLYRTKVKVYLVFKLFVCVVFSFFFFANSEGKVQFSFFGAIDIMNFLACCLSCLFKPLA